jgi:cysteine desulfurase
MQKSHAIYLDYNAGAPLASAFESTPGKSASRGFLFEEGARLIGNPSSTHAFGRALRAQLAEAREQVGQSLGLSPEHCEGWVFCSSGTEANQAPLSSFLRRARSWAVGAADHSCVLSGREAFRERGGTVHTLPVDAQGRTRLDALPRGVEVLSLLWVNNETGSKLSLSEAVREARARGVRWIQVDAAQAWGKREIRLLEMGADAVSFSGHKIGAPGGTGGYWLSPEARADVRKHSEWPGRQEHGLRAGTENVLMALALARAAASVRPMDWAKHCAERKALLVLALEERVPEIVWNAGSELPSALENTLNFRVPGAERPGWVAALDLRGFAVSSGAACSAGSEQPSSVLLACGLTEAQARGSVRVSWGPETEPDSLRAFADAVAEVARAMRA